MKNDKKKIKKMDERKMKLSENMVQEESEMELGQEGNEVKMM